LRGSLVQRFIFPLTLTIRFAHQHASDTAAVGVNWVDVFSSFKAARKPIESPVGKFLRVFAAFSVKEFRETKTQPLVLLCRALTFRGKLLQQSFETGLSQFPSAFHFFYSLCNSNPVQ